MQLDQQEQRDILQGGQKLLTPPQRGRTIKNSLDELNSLELMVETNIHKGLHGNQSPQKQA